MKVSNAPFQDRLEAKKVYTEANKIVHHKITIDSTVSLPNNTQSTTSPSISITQPSSQTNNQDIDLTKMVKKLKVIEADSSEQKKKFSEGFEAAGSIIQQMKGSLGVLNHQVSLQGQFLRFMYSQLTNGKALPQEYQQIMAPLI